MNGNQKTLFTDGAYRIHLEHAFDAISDLGYSVNIQPGGKAICPYYSYSTCGQGNWEIPSKPTTPGDEGDGDGTANRGTVYLEVQPIFRTRNLELDPGKTWCPDDSLISAMARFESMSNMQVTGEDHLYKNGTYGRQRAGSPRQRL